MIKKIFFIILVNLFFSNLSFGAGSDGGGDGKKKTYYEKAHKIIKLAKKYEKKGKIDKAKKKYQEALNLLVKSNNKKPMVPDTLNYLGFTSRKIGDFRNAEIYYLLGLEIDPIHKGINEYLGELYVNTNRIDKAKERLKILEDCNCEEYEELSKAIKSGSSKY